MLNKILPESESEVVAMLALFPHVAPVHVCFTVEYNLHRLISAAIGRWVTSDPAELPFLPGRKKLCTNAVEYNP